MRQQALEPNSSRVWARSFRPKEVATPLALEAAQKCPSSLSFVTAWRAKIQTQLPCIITLRLSINAHIVTVRYLLFPGEVGAHLTLLPSQNGPLEILSHWPMRCHACCLCYTTTTMLFSIR